MTEVIATETVVVLDENIGANRKVFAGQPIPPDLIGPYKKATGDTSSDADDGGVDYASQSVEDLQAEVERRGLEVEGTGANGNVVKADLVAALTVAAHD